MLTLESRPPIPIFFLSLCTRRVGHISFLLSCTVMSTENSPPFRRLRGEGSMETLQNLWPTEVVSETFSRGWNKWDPTSSPFCFLEICRGMKKGCQLPPPPRASDPTRKYRRWCLGLSHIPGRSPDHFRSTFFFFAAGPQRARKKCRG